MAFYLKYRPQKLSELGEEEISLELAKAVSGKALPQAFLFAGPRGVGKTSAARIIAKIANCEAHSEGVARGEPCNKCDSCLSVTAGNNLDVLEIDAASSRGIDDVRDLRDKIKLAPSHAKYKVYILDEVHMLTTEAFNALLKTLEEPPPHAIFILCTTAPEKLPATIVSRCLLFNFRKASLSEITKGLEKIVKEENLKVEEGVLPKIAKASDGSFRDSQKILEQLSFGGEEITNLMAEKILGSLGQIKPQDLLNFLLARDAKGAILEIKRVVEAGGNLAWYTEQLLETLRGALLGKFGVRENGAKQGETDAALEKLPVEEIKRLIELFSRAALEFKLAVIPSLPLEMVAVEWCGGPSDSEGGGEKGTEEKVYLAGEDLSQEVARGASLTTLAKVLGSWPEILKNVGPLNHSVQAFLRAARPFEFDGENLTIEVFYQFHKMQLETEKCRHIVEQVASEVLAAPVKIKCILRERILPKPEVKSDLTEELPPDIIKVAEEIFGTAAN